MTSERRTATRFEQVSHCSFNLLGRLCA